MPELPEVETIVTRLNAAVKNYTVTQIAIHTPKSFSGDEQSLIGLSIQQVTRRAKLIRFHFPGGINLLGHLKMTGQFIFIGSDSQRVGGGHPTADWVNELPSGHTRVSVSLHTPDNDVASLFFNDQRIFGWLKVMTDEQVENEYSKYGPDIHTDLASLTYFSEKLLKTARPIKQVIMDNSVVAGVGNIYACDGLNLARIHPKRPAKSLNENEVRQLLASLKTVINLGIKLGGATIEHFSHIDGFSGKYQEQVRVYGKEGQACPNCGSVVEKVQLAGRGTYFCSNCQV